MDFFFVFILLFLVVVLYRFMNKNNKIKCPKCGISNYETISEVPVNFELGKRADADLKITRKCKKCGTIWAQYEKSHDSGGSSF